MDVGTTVAVEITDLRDGYLQAERRGSKFTIYGDGSIGETKSVRVTEVRGSEILAITNGTSIRLRIDDVVDESTVRADPDYGPVFVSASLTPGTWWRCVVTAVRDDHVTARPRNRIPRNSSIRRGAPPDDPTQSYNHLINRRKP